MKFSSPVFFLLSGAVLTAAFVFVPQFYDPLIMETLPVETIEEDKGLVDYLVSIQNQDNIIVGVHGYIHRCPVCGETTHEYHCPEHDIPIGTVEDTVKKGINIFDDAGLDAPWIAPPGMTYDDKFLYVTGLLGYITEPYIAQEVSGFEAELVSVLKPEALEKVNQFKAKDDTIIFREYTWEWRNKGLSQEEYNNAKIILENDVSEETNGVLLHIQDYNERTESFVEEALENYPELKFVRVDDIASGHDVKKLKKLVNLANEHNVLLFIAVIPAHLSNVGSIGGSGAIKATWFVFVPFFFFPLAVMVPLHWHERGKIRRRGRIIPHSPKVSLILPAYNEEKFIEKSITQSLKQDYHGEIEVVVVDDGSTDRTYEIASRFAENYPNVRVYQHEKNSGKPAALNTGFARATGTISVFSDTDSHLDADLVSRMVPHFDDPQVGMVAGMIIIDNEINLLTKLQQIEYLYNQEIVRFCQTTHKGVLICPGAATAVRTEIARAIPSTERTITEDADFTFEVAKAGWKVAQEPEAISRTDAPVSLAAFIDQRKRWLYGVLQTIWLHKWAVFFKDTKVPNLWVLWAWIGYITCPITTLSVLALPFFLWLIGPSYLIFLAFYSVLVAGIYGFAHWYGIKQYTHANKKRLILLLPLYMIYQYLLNVLLFYLVLAWLTRRGVKVHYGGRYIHAV
jgi:cellulose synthase/poly-beta-1,6-N-acetylglucosamine synthase-like glycosyltransferase